jgi:hypothetical protein
MNGIEWVKAGDLRLPASRPRVDLGKLARPFRQFGSRLDGMPPLEVTRCAGGEMFINNGVTRATRAYRYAGADALVPAVVIDHRPHYDATHLPRVSQAR